MKRFRLALLAAACVAFAAAPGHARQGGNLGLGFIAGLPTGLSGKLWLNNTNAIDMIVGFDSYADYIILNADYVWHEFNLIPVRAGQLPLYYGMGANLGVARNAPGVGLRGVVGLEYLFADAPLDAFIELGPGALIIPSAHFGFSAGLGMRFFF